MQKRYTYWAIFTIALLVILIIAIAVSLSTGEMKIKLSELPEIIRNKEGMAYMVLAKIRLPRLLLGIAVGGGLSLSGAILQGIYRNPLVEPYTLGISGGATLGVAVAIVFGLHSVIGSLVFPLFGFSGALIILFLVYFLEPEEAT